MSEITVVVPVYNEAPFLRRCLDSLVNQISKPEVIIIDDGSTDGSREICEEYAKKFGFGLTCQNHGGVSKARNVGIDNCKTKWITFLDSDDELAKESIQRMECVSKVTKNMAQFGQLRVYGNNPPVRKYVDMAGFYTLRKLPKQWCMVWNKIYRVEFLNKFGIRFDEEMLYGEDEIFNIDCITRAKGFRVMRDATIIRHFDNKESICHSLTKAQLWFQIDKLREKKECFVRPENRDFVQQVLDMHLERRMQDES